MTNHEGHIKLWDELASTGSRDKQEAFAKLFPDVTDGHAYDAACFACAEDAERMSWAYPNNTVACTLCPIADEGRRDCAYGYYDKWCSARTSWGRKRLAAKIRDLPWKEAKA